jgi:hypothetical protein
MTLHTISKKASWDNGHSDRVGHEMAIEIDPSRQGRTISVGNLTRVDNAEDITSRNCVRQIE